MKFLGRVSELRTLEREFARGSGFVVVYGRRRVGKTTLIKEFLKGKEGLYFLATEELEGGNLRNFSRVLSHFTGQEYLRNAHFSDWEPLFQALAQFHPERKKVLVLDEFQYLTQVNPAFPSILQRAWDETLRAANLMLILCGSLIGMMQEQTLSHRSPLYGRRTAQIRLSPLSFLELLDDGADRTFAQRVETYAVTGGVPKYHDFFDNDLPLMENIEREVLQKNGFLYEEPIFLLEREVRETVGYFSIMRSIAAGNHKLSKIAGNLETSSHQLSPYLRTLMDLDLLEKRVPVTESRPDKSRKGLYRIRDNFILFWFRFVCGYRGELEMDNLDYVMRILRRSFIESHVSGIYEDVCREILLRLCRTGRLDFSPAPARVGSYWNANTEIDVAALDTERKHAILGECKYHAQPVDTSVLSALVRKSENIPELDGYARTFLLFSKSGFTERLRQTAARRKEVVLIDGLDVL